MSRGTYKESCPKCQWNSIIVSDSEEINYKCNDCFDITSLDQAELHICGNEDCLSKNISEWGGNCPVCSGPLNNDYSISDTFYKMSKDNPHIGYTHSGYNWKAKRSH